MLGRPLLGPLLEELEEDLIMEDVVEGLVDVLMVNAVVSMVTVVHLQNTVEGVLDVNPVMVDVGKSIN
jgi:hypothetical protein